MNEQVKKEEQTDWKKLAEERMYSWKRAAADFENYKKRREKEDQALVMFTKEMVLFKLLPTLEALQPALQQAPDDEKYKIWKAGVEGIVKELEKTLADLGVERIKTVGEPYNHELHEAIEMLEGKGESGKIFEEVAPGYKINGKVIRPAKVKVSK